MSQGRLKTACTSTSTARYFTFSYSSLLLNPLCCLSSSLLRSPITAYTPADPPTAATPSSTAPRTHLAHAPLFWLSSLSAPELHPATHPHGSDTAEDAEHAERQADLVAVCLDLCPSATIQPCSWRSRMKKTSCSLPMGKLGR
jgi:hypothetical protein